MSRLVVGRMFIHLQKTVEGMGIWKEGVRGGYIHTANSDSKQLQQTANSKQRTATANSNSKQQTATANSYSKQQTATANSDSKQQTAR